MQRRVFALLKSTRVSIFPLTVISAVNRKWQTLWTGQGYMYLLNVQM